MTGTTPTDGYASGAGRGASRPARRVTRGESLNVYIVAAVLVAGALLSAEVSTKNLDLTRALYSIWVTTVLLAPAMWFYLFRRATRAAYSYWMLFWTFSFLAYLVHFYWGVFVIFGGVREAFAGQGAIIASTNFLLTAWWGLDVVLAWAIKGEPRWVLIQRIGAHLLVFAAFSVTSLLLKDGTIRIIGGFMTGSVVLCALVRVLAWERTPRPAVAGQTPD